MNVHRNMYAYDIKYDHTRYGWIMSKAVHIYCNMAICHVTKATGDCTVRLMPS